MKHLLITLLALTCATLHAQSVVVKRTDAENVRGTATRTETSVLTNLLITGEGLNPSAAGTYLQVADYGGSNSWEMGNFSVKWYDPATIWLIYEGAISMWWSGTLLGDYAVLTGGSTGTPNVVYSYQTNYAYTTSAKGTATP